MSPVVHELVKQSPNCARVLLNNELKLQPLLSDTTLKNMVPSSAKLAAEMLRLVSKRRGKGEVRAVTGS